jgi:hypothetical protein
MCVHVFCFNHETCNNKTSGNSKYYCPVAIQFTILVFLVQLILFKLNKQTNKTGIKQSNERKRYNKQTIKIKMKTYLKQKVKDPLEE